MKSKGIKFGALLAVMLVMSMTFVSGVLAQPDDEKEGDKVESNTNFVKGDIVIKGKVVKEDINDKDFNGKGDGQAVTISPVGGEISILAGKEWSASTDLYNKWYDPSPILYTDSKSKDGDSIWDIDKIEVRGRVWRQNLYISGENKLIFDDTDTQSNSADASIYWKRSCFFCGGDYTARGNHIFEEEGYNSWYPVTEDALQVG